MSEEVTVLEVRSDALARKHEWLAKRDEMLVMAAMVDAITTTEHLDAAGSLQTAMSKHIKELEKARKEVTTPIDEIKKAIMAQEKELGSPLQAEHDRLKKLNSEYATKLAAAAEAERRRQQAEFERQLAEKLAAEEAFGEEAAEPQMDLGAAPVTQAPAKTHTSNQRFVTRWHIEVVLPTTVPREFCMPDEKAIKLYLDYQVKMGKTPEIPGVRFWKTVDAQAK